METPKYFLIFAMAAVVLSLFNHGASAQPVTLRSDSWMTDGQVFDIVHSKGIAYIGGQFSNVLMSTGSGAALDVRTAIPFPLPRVNGVILAVLPDGNGGWYIGGSFTAVDDFARNSLAHIFSNGTLDLAWRSEVSGGNARIFALAMRGAVVYVGGEFTHINGQPRNNIAALDAINGQVIGNWDANANSSVRALAVDGRTIYAGGSFSSIGGRNNNNNIVALDSTRGTATASWITQTATNGTVRALVVAGGTLYVGGIFIKIGGADRNRLAALNLVTGNAMAWNPNVDPTVTSIVNTSEVCAIDVTGTLVYIGGLFGSAGGRTRTNIAAIDANGISTNWDPGASGQVLAIAANGEAIFVGGKFTTIGKERRRIIAALSPDSDIALPWNPNLSIFIPPVGISDTSNVYALVTSGSTVYAGGSMKTSWMPRSNLAAFNVTTGRPTAWNPSASGAPSPPTIVRVLAVSGDTVYVGGNFTVINGVPKNRLAAIHAITGIATSWNPNVNGEVNTIDVAKGIVYFGGQFTQPRVNIAAARVDNGNIVDWPNPPTITLSQPVRALAVRDTAVYFGGDFTNLGTPPRNCLAALDARTGQLLTTWNPNVGGASPISVHALLLSDTTVYAGGRFATVGGHPRTHIVAIGAASGIPIMTWNPNISGTTGAPTNIPVRAITISDSIVYFGGEFTQVGNDLRANAAAVRADNGMLTGWIVNVTGGTTGGGFTPPPSVSALEVAGETFFVGGNFTNIAGMPHTFFAALGETPLNPAPTLRSMNPKSGKRLQTLEVVFEGTNFIEGISAVNAGHGITVNSITVASPKRLTANITISATASTGPRNFFVSNPPPGGGSSRPIPFTINNPAPRVASIAPKSGLRSQTLNIIVTGSNFISGATMVSFGPDIKINSVAIVNTTRLIVNITIGAEAEIDDHDVTVINAFPGGGEATLEDAFTVDHSTPILSGLTPASGNRMQTLDVDFHGGGFINGITKIEVGEGIKINSITIESAKKLRVNLTISVHAALGPRSFTVINSRPGGGASESRTFTVTNPKPELASINPDSAGRGQTRDVFLIGKNFIDEVSTVSFGADIIINEVEVESDTQIIANITISLNAQLGARTVSVTNPAPGGGTAPLNAGFRVVNPQPALSSVTPNVGSLGQRLTVTLSGTNFIAKESHVDFGADITIDTMAVINSTQITANITIDWEAETGSRAVSVANAGPGGGVSTLPRAFVVSSGAIVHFSLPTDLRGVPGNKIEIPLDIDPAEHKVGSFDAKLSFDSKVLSYEDFVPGPILSDADWQIDVNPSSSSISIGAFIVDGSLPEAGTAVVLLFNVRESPDPGTTVPLVLSNLAATDTKAKPLPATGTNGLFKIPADATLSGKLQFIGDKPLAGDTLKLEITGHPTRWQISDEEGAFSFEGIPLGTTVFLTPQRLAGGFPEGTITAGDALKAFKGRAGGPESLNGYESLATDVNGDCQLTSGDALAILKRATGKWESFRRSAAADWRFVDDSFDLSRENWCAAPSKRVYAPLLEDHRKQDFDGVILGDVNRSFGEEVEKISGAHLSGLAVKISDPELLAGNTQIEFTVEVSTPHQAYNSFDLTLAYEATAIRITNVSLESMAAPEEWQMDWHVKSPGVLRIAGFSMTTACIQGQGPLIAIQAELQQSANAGNVLQIDVPFALFGFDGKETFAQTEAGNLKITARTPQQYALEQNYPNPFSQATPLAQTVIQYSLPQAGVVHLQIYDMLGHLVRTLASGHQEAGAHKIIWDGHKDDGSPAATGIYLYRLEAGTFTKTNKLVLQK